MFTPFLGIQDLRKIQWEQHKGCEFQRSWQPVEKIEADSSPLHNPHHCCKPEYPPYKEPCQAQKMENKSPRLSIVIRIEMITCQNQQKCCEEKVGGDQEQLQYRESHFFGLLQSLLLLTDKHENFRVNRSGTHRFWLGKITMSQALSTFQNFNCHVSLHQYRL